MGPFNYRPREKGPGYTIKQLRAAAKLERADANKIRDFFGSIPITASMFSRASFLENLADTLEKDMEIINGGKEGTVLQS